MFLIKKTLNSNTLGNCYIFDLAKAHARQNNPVFYNLQGAAEMTASQLDSVKLSWRGCKPLWLVSAIAMDSRMLMPAMGERIWLSV